MKTNNILFSFTGKETKKLLHYSLSFYIVDVQSWYTCKFLLDRRGQLQNDTRNGIKQQNLRKK